MFSQCTPITLHAWRELVTLGNKHQRDPGSRPASHDTWWHFLHPVPVIVTQKLVFFLKLGLMQEKFRPVGLESMFWRSYSFVYWDRKYSGTFLPITPFYFKSSSAIYPGICTVSWKNSRTFCRFLKEKRQGGKKEGKSLAAWRKTNHAGLKNNHHYRW